GLLTTIAGTGLARSTGDGGSAREASLNTPSAITIGPDGSIYITEVAGHRVRKIAPDGTISTIAGTGVAGYSGDGGPAGDAALNFPSDLALDAAGNLFIADTENSRIRVVLAAPPSSSPLPTTLTFSARAGGAAAAPQQLLADASVAGAPFSAAADPGSEWLVINPGEGGTPRLIEVSADPARLQPGRYQGTIRVRLPGALPSERVIAVTFNVDASLAPQLAVAQRSLSFPFARGGGARTLTITVSNAGGGEISTRASVRTTAGGRWLSVSPASFSLSPSRPAELTVSADPAALAPGAYSGSVVIEGSGQTRTIPVTMLLSAKDRLLLLSQSGLSFTAAAGGGVVPPQSFAVLSNGGLPVNFTAARARVQGGADWLSVSPGRGTAAADPSAVEVRVNAAGLAPGTYSGQVQVDAPQAANTPLATTVYLQVLPAGQDPGAEVDLSELVFSGAAGSPSPGSGELRLYGVGATAKSYHATISTEDGANWMIVAPRDGLIPPDRPARVVVQPVTGNLAAGVYRGNIAFQFSDGRVRNVRVSFIVSGRAGNTLLSGPRLADGDCTPSILVPALSSLGQSFEVAAGWPVALVAQVRDNCGGALLAGKVTAILSNGDSPVAFQPLRDGNWHGTWPTGSRVAKVRMNLVAESSNGLRGTRELSGELRGVQDLPRLEIQSLLPFAPGALISITGERLADSQAKAASVPLPTSLAGTRVLVAGRELPLVAISERQLDAVLPYGIEPNTSLQMIVQRGGSLSRPVSVDIAPAQPSVAQRGGVQAVRPQAGVPYQFALDPGIPARAGDKLVILCTGLGEVNVAFVAGDAGPIAPRAQTRETVRLTIGGVEANVTFAGLTPGQIGVYQVESVLPANAPSGNQIPVVLSAAGLESQPVNIAIE
ncbi:MAG: hypothetical protein ABIZ80_21640, partial [Bryobacteraceae bacterium]